FQERGSSWTCRRRLPAYSQEPVRIEKRLVLKNDVHCRVAPMDALRLYSPFWLILAPLAMVGLWWRYRPRRRGGGGLSWVGGLRNLPVALAQRVRRGLPFFCGTGICLVILGLARPQSGRSESRITGEGIAIEIVLDVSGSMEALDFQLGGRDVSRLEAVKH